MATEAAAAAFGTAATRSAATKAAFFRTSILTSDLHDRRAVSLRGYTIPQGLIMNQVAQYKEIKGALSQHAGPGDTEVVELNLQRRKHGHGSRRYEDGDLL